VTPTEAVGREDAPIQRWRSPHRSPGIAVSDVGEILDAAASILAETGFAKFSMQELADTVGIAKPTLYAYVGTKPSLLEGLFDRVLGYAEELIAQARERPDPRDGLRAVIAAWTATSIHRTDYYRVYFGAAQELPGPAREQVRHRSSLIMRSIREIIERCQRVGSCDRDADPTVLAYAIAWMCIGTGQWYRSGGPIDEQRLVSHYLRLVESGFLTPTDGSATPSEPTKTRP
jgi:TetR/AcrR family transcriptional regulator, cholesterol catabolism regulator